ncbi:phosphotransferase [Microbacterium sp. GCS4]|uniref:phosphotransferase n=1 Tax=Microbacterium sp. GCS4 TaxID=1692239 RepID=UPI00068076CA|nr:phosphotransferase [Microbacterium sp. GCS4]KNY05445.1 hypothetical protein AKH00_14000 [Microbacterium sp. GCS4]
MVPGERARWTPPLPEEVWSGLLEEWTSHVGRVDSVAVYHRPQTGRVGLSALLLREGRGVGFVRVSNDVARVNHEARVVRALNRARPETFRVAELVAAEDVNGLGWMLSESVPNYPLGAVRRSRTREAVAAEISDVLSDALDRPADVPPHWTVAHGDLSPWNLRRRISGAVQVIDWEDAAYAPPGVDALYGALTAHVSLGTPLPVSAPAEAHAWVDDLLSGRIATQPDAAAEITRTRDVLRAIPVAR